MIFTTYAKKKKSCVFLFVMQLCWLVSCLRSPLMFLLGHISALQKQTRRGLKRQLKAVPTLIYHFTSLHALCKNPVIYGSAYCSLHRSMKRGWPSCRLSTMLSRNPKKSCSRILPPCFPLMNPSCVIWRRLEPAGGALSQRMVSERDMSIPNTHAKM